MKPGLVLASTSPYRVSLLGRLGIPFEAVPHRCDESAVKALGLAPEELASTLAREKARSLAADHPGRLILGGDQVVDLDGEVLGKPGTEERAVLQLRRLSGREHRLLTAIALATPSGEVDVRMVVNRMRLRSLTESELSRYVERDRPLDCAGSYRVESLGIALFESIEGGDLTAVMGLPLVEVVSMLSARGLRVLGS